MKESSEEVVCKNCHPEFISGSHPLLTMQEAEMLKRVQHDNTWGFTLIEILVVVLIIGILGAIMLPQYQRAVLKSRYSGMMPIAKALAEGNEVFFLEHGHYSENPADLLVAGRDKNAGAYPDGTRVLMYDDDGLSYVRVMNDNVPNARYVVYQKHSTNFPDTTWCEASDEQAEAMCVALGGVLPDGLEGNSGADADWTAYLLSGRYGSTDSFAGARTGDDEPGADSATEEPTPLGCQVGDTPPEDMPVIDTSVTTSNTAIGTPKCVNGKWAYEWTGGKKYTTSHPWAGANAIDCKATSAYECAGSTFSGDNTYCYGYNNGCVGSLFSGRGATCVGFVENGCVNSIFTGRGAICQAGSANTCAGSIISGELANCYGLTLNGCAGAIIQAGAYCSPAGAGTCDGALYGTNPNKSSSLMGSCDDRKGYCPVGVPIWNVYNWNSNTGAFEITGWKGNCCNPAYMVSGVCPDGIAECAN